MSGPKATYLPGCFRFRWDEQEAEITFDRLHEGRQGELSGEIVVKTSRQPTPGLLHQARMNLTSTQARATVRRELSNRQSGTDWGELLEQACFLTLRRYRQGDPIVDLRRVPPRCGSRFLLEPWVEYAGPTILFADGGSGKSLFAMAIAASVAGDMDILGSRPARPTPVLYLDWEADQETHADRLAAIGAGCGVFERDALPPVYYRRQMASLPESVHDLRRQIVEQQIGLVVIDSMAMARGDAPESAEATIRLFTAARTLGVPWLAVDHVTKNGETEKTKPFGSVFTVNSARITWGMEKADEDADGNTTIALTNHKVNNGKLMKRRAYRVEFMTDAAGQPGMVHYEPVDFRDVPGMLPRLGQAQQIATILGRHNGTMLVEEIKQALEEEGSAISASNLRLILSRNKDRFAAVPDGKAMRWGLLSRWHTEEHP